MLSCYIKLANISLNKGGYIWQLKKEKQQRSKQKEK